MGIKKPLIEEKMKDKTARICEICEELWPEEWKGKYTGARKAFRDFLNHKTELNVDHMIDKSAALIAWVDALEILLAEQD